MLLVNYKATLTCYSPSYNRSNSPPPPIKYIFFKLLQQYVFLSTAEKLVLNFKMFKKVVWVEFY